MKMLLGSVFLKFFFETLWNFFSKDYSTDFQKSGTNGKSGHSPVCLLTPLVCIHLTFYSLRKSVGGIFDPNFSIFYVFSKTTQQKSEILDLTDKTGVYTQKVMAIRKAEFSIF